MRKISLGLMALALIATPALAQMGGMGGMDGGMGGGGMGGGMGGGGMGGRPGGGGPPDDGGGKPRAPREMKPISIEKFDKAVERMFAIADANHDGTVTLDEFNQVISARREAVIRNRFKVIDTNHNGQIDFDEFLNWQRKMGSAALSEGMATAYAEVVPDSITPELGDSDTDEALMMAVEPLNAVTITNANTNYDAGVTLPELIAYEHIRFNKADTDKDGFLSRQELDAMRPDRRRGPGGPGGGPGGPGGGPAGGPSGGRPMGPPPGQ